MANLGLAVPEGIIAHLSEPTFLPVLRVASLLSIVMETGETLTADRRSRG